MKNMNLSGKISKTTIILLLILTVFACKQENQDTGKTINKVLKAEEPEYFHLRPELEKMYGYTQAVRIGNIVKIGGIVSIDDKGNPTGKDDFLQQMKNCYTNIEKVLNKYGCTFNDVVVENLYTTSMSELHMHALYRHEIYKNHFPAGSWIGVKELGLPEMKIEIEIEALVPQN